LVAILLALLHWLGRPDPEGLVNGPAASTTRVAGHVEALLDPGSALVAPDLSLRTVDATPAGADDPEGPIRRFSDWSRRYVEADEPSRRAMLDEGADLAKAHRIAIKSLIVSDPRRAIEMAVPMVIRQKLPPQLLAMLEERISGIGALEVLAISPDSDPSEPIVRRFTRLGDREWRAYVYGRRAGEMSKESTMLNGIAIDRIMAVDESPIRSMELGEVPDPAKEVIEKCPVSGLSTEVEREVGESMPPVTAETPAIEAGDQIIFLCDGGHIRQLVSEILAGEGSTGGPSSPTGSLPLTRRNSTGLRRHLYMRVIFPDRLDEFQTDTEAWVACRQLDEYFKEISYGKLAFQGTVTPTLVLPRTEAWYKGEYTATGSNSPIMNDAKEAARQLGYPPEDFHHFVVIYVNGPGTFGGLGSVNGANTWLRTTSIGTFRHEIGHNIGVWHSNFWNTAGASVIGPGQNQEYGHNNDVMGSSGSGGHFNASMKQQLEWITPQTFHSVTSGGLYRIHQFDQVSQDPELRYALRVAKDADRDYWVEFRQKLTTSPWFMNGISINWSPWGASGDTSNSGSNLGPQLLDMNPGSADDRTDSPLVIGRTFSDVEADVHITPVAMGGTVPQSVDVRVHIGTAAANAAPELIIRPSATSIAPGGAITFTAEASDPDADPLAFHWNFGDKLAGFNGPSFSTDNSAVQTKTFASVGWYAVQCTASDMKGGVDCRTVLIQVGAPSTLYLSGIVTDDLGAPLRGARVHNGLSGTSYRGALTDSEGRYFITNLVSGTLTLAASLPGTALAPSGFSNPVTVGPSQTDKHFAGTMGVTVRMVPVSTDAAEGGSAATWRFIRTGGNAASLNVYTDFSGSASTADYSLSPAANTAIATPFEIFTIPAGQDEMVVDLSAVQDTVQEGTEILVVSLVNGGGGYLPVGPQTLAISIGDDDTTKPRVSLRASDDEASESGSADPATFLVSRSGSTASALTVNFTLDATTPANASAPYATPVVDFASVGTSVVIPAGQSFVPVTLAPVDDDLAEGMELVKMNLASNAAYLLDSVTQATVKINDNDQPTITLSATDSTGTEGADAARFTLTRDGNLSEALTVHYSTGGDALHGTDYGALPGFVTFAPGGASAVVDILPVDDSRGEASQSVVLQLRSAAAYRVSGTGNASVTILDNGDLPAVSVFAMDGDVAEPSDGGQFRIVTAGTGTGNITVNYQIAGTAQAGLDYTTLSGSLSMGKNTSSNLAVTVINDAIAEDAESILLTLLPGAGYQLDPAQSASIVMSDDDAVNMVSISANTLSATEGGLVKLYLSRSGSTTSDLTLPFALGGTAQAGADYVAPSGMATIPAGSLGVSVDVTTINDTEAEGIETLIATIAPDGGSTRTYGVEVSTVNVTILDNDSGFNNTLSFTQPKHVFEEGDGAVTIPVLRAGTGTASTTCSVEYTVRYATAEGGGIDYRLVGGRLEFAPGELTKDVPVEWIDDSLPETVEALVVQLRNPAGATLPSGGALASVFLLDNEPRASIEVVDPFADETGDTATFRISREGASPAALTVPLVFTGDAVAGTDYVALPPNVVIPAGAASTTLTLIPIANPSAREPVAVVVSLDAAGEDSTLSRRSATAWIGDGQTDHPPFTHLFSPLGEGQGIGAGATLRLIAAAQDDSPGGVVSAWTRVSGPGTVVFEDASSPVTDAVFSLPGRYLLQMTATDGTASSTIEVPVTVGGAVSPWTETNIGSNVYGGASASQRGVTLLSSSGSAFSGSTDTLFLRHRPLQDDGEIIARVRTLFRPSDSARVGVMIRENTSNNSRFAGMTMAPSAGFGGSTNRSSYFRRTSSGASLTAIDTDGPTPSWWVRVTRTGNLFTSYDSPDGSNWTRRGQDTLAVAGSAFAGLALTSAVSSDVVLAQVDRVRVAGTLENIGPEVDIVPPPGNASVGVPFSLSAVVSDDSYPEDRGAVSLSWSFVSGPAPPVFESPEAANSLVTFVHSGLYRLRLAADDGGVTTSETVDVEVESRPATVTLTRLSQVHDGTPRVVVAATEPPGLAVEITYDGSTTPPVDAGSYPIQVSVIEPDYSGSASGTLVVAKSGQTISFAPVADQLATSSLPLVASGGGSGQPVIFAVTQGQAILTGGNVATFAAAGLVTITASQAGGTNHFAAPDVSVSFNVLKAPASVALDPASLLTTYNGSVRQVTYTTNPPGLEVILTYDGLSTAPTGAGSYPVIASISDPRYHGNDAGTLVVGKASQAIDFPPLANALANASVPLSATGGGSGLPVTFTVTAGPATVEGGSLLVFSGAGQVTVSASQAGDANHHAATPVARTLSVSKAPVSSLSLSALHQVFDGSPREVIVTSVPPGLTSDVTYEGDAEAPVGTGVYDVVAIVDDPIYEGSAEGTLFVDDPARLDLVPGGVLPALSALGSIDVSTFALGRYEVTWGLWKRIRDWASLHGYDLALAGVGCDDDHPVRGISWFDAVKWCNARTEWENATLGISCEAAYRLSGSVYRTGQPASSDEIEVLSATSGYRLPHASEREYAARGGRLSSGLPYPGGVNAVDLGWHAANSSAAICDLAGGRGTRPVGALLPNELGLYDLAGNVGEWSGGALSASPGRRLVFGGGWDAPESALLLTALTDAAPTGATDQIGFRVARSVSTALANALDNDQLLWESGGSQPWYAQAGDQTDGVDAAASGALGGEEASWVETTVTGPGNLTFQWKIRLPAGGGALIVAIDGEEIARISGATEWANQSVYVPPGTHLIRWTYQRSLPQGLAPLPPPGANGGWLDAVVFSEAVPPTVSTGSITALDEERATGTGVVNGDGGSPIEGWGMVVSIERNPLIGGAPVYVAAASDTGAFEVDMNALSPGTTYRARAFATNAAGTGYGSEIAFTTDETVDLAEGVASRQREILRGDRHVFHFTLSGPRHATFSTAGGAALRAELFDARGDLMASFYGDGDFDIGELLYAGDYALHVRRDADGGGVQTYDLTFDVTAEATTRPDAAVGFTDLAQTGVGVVGSDAGQVLSLSSKDAEPVSGVATFRNGGTLPDELILSGSGGSPSFGVSYFGDRGNVTAQILAGTLRTAALVEGDDPVSVTVSIVPNRKKLTEKRGKRNKIVTLKRIHGLSIRVRSDFDSTLGDEVRILVRTL
jgi:hypothetical protein